MDRFRPINTQNEKVSRKKICRALQNARIDLEFFSLAVSTPLSNGPRDFLLGQIRLILNQIAGGISPSRLSFKNLLETVASQNKSLSPVLIRKGEFIE